IRRGVGMVVIVMVFAVHHSMHLLVDMLYAVFGLLAESASHRASDGEAFAVRKLDDDTEKISASRCLAEDIIHRVGPADVVRYTNARPKHTSSTSSGRTPCWAMCATRFSGQINS